jgi:hypothetical protein|tara:strand:+ start:431150 stop:431461 length:312 start_codon:yes stop_codon:yes gene_type:complete
MPTDAERMEAQVEYWLLEKKFRELRNHETESKIQAAFDPLIRGYLVLVATCKGRGSDPVPTITFLPVTGRIWLAGHQITFKCAPFSIREVSKDILQHLRLSPP